MSSQWMARAGRGSQAAITLQAGCHCMSAAMRCWWRLLAAAQHSHQRQPKHAAHTRRSTASCIGWPASCYLNQHMQAAPAAGKPPTSAEVLRQLHRLGGQQDDHFDDGAIGARGAQRVQRGLRGRQGAGVEPGVGGWEQQQNLQHAPSLPLAWVLACGWWPLVQGMRADTLDSNSPRQQQLTAATTQPPHVPHPHPSQLPSSCPPPSTPAAPLRTTRPAPRPPGWPGPASP